jgi:hypothetical protein
MRETTYLRLFHRRAASFASLLLAYFLIRDQNGVKNTVEGLVFTGLESDTLMFHKNGVVRIVRPRRVRAQGL